MFRKEAAGGCIWVGKGGTGGSGGNDGGAKVQAFWVEAGIGRYSLLVDGRDIDLMNCRE